MIRVGGHEIHGGGKAGADRLWTAAVPIDSRWTAPRRTGPARACPPPPYGAPRRTGPLGGPAHTRPASLPPWGSDRAAATGGKPFHFGNNCIASRVCAWLPSQGPATSLVKVGTGG